MKTKWLLNCLLWSIVTILSAQELTTTITLTNIPDRVNTKLSNQIVSNINLLFKSIDESLESGKAPRFPSTVLTKDGMVELVNLWNNSPFYTSQAIVKAKWVNLPQASDEKGIMEVRDIPIEFQNETGIPQTLNVTFNAKGLITAVDLGLDPVAFRNIMGKAIKGSEDEVRRQIVNKFLEQVRTAYNRKDISYLTQVYSDSALIITGRVLTPPKVSVNRDEQGIHLNMKQRESVEYVRQTKQQYLDRLRALFSRNQYINVDFENVEIRSHFSKKDVYCVSLDQCWTSQSAKISSNSKYHDEGYLFLMIDFRNQDKPEITIRCWQAKEQIDNRNENKIEEHNIGRILGDIF